MIVSRLIAYCLHALFLLTAVAWSAPADTSLELERRAHSINAANPNSVQRVWPGNTLTYCFADSTSESKLDKIVNDGWQLWVNAGVTTLQIQKVPKPADTSRTLVITATSDHKHTTVVGFRSDPTMRYDPNAHIGTGNNAANMAHELGHAFGLLHEHQRPDAGQYVSVNYESLSDYDTFKKAGWDMTVLTSSQYQAYQAGFSGSDMTPYPQSGYGYDASGAFDMDSIMRYSAKSGGRTVMGVRKKVLSRTDGQTLKDNLVVSPGDAARINALYH